MPLLIVEKDGGEVTLAFDGDHFTIGRRNSCDLVLDSTSVSRHHATIVRDGGIFLIRDEGSSNGTLLNNESIQQAELSEGDVLTIGETRIRVQLEADGAGDPAPAGVAEAFAEADDEIIEEAPGPLSDEELAELAGGGDQVATRTASRRTSRPARSERRLPRERESVRSDGSAYRREAPAEGSNTQAIKMVCLAVVGVCVLAIFVMAYHLLTRTPRGKGGIRREIKEGVKMWADAARLFRQAEHLRGDGKLDEANQAFARADHSYERLEGMYPGRGYEYIGEKHAFLLARWRGVKEQLFIRGNRRKRNP